MLGLFLLQLLILIIYFKIIMYVINFHFLQHINHFYSHNNLIYLKINNMKKILKLINKILHNREQSKISKRIFPLWRGAFSG